MIVDLVLKLVSCFIGAYAGMAYYERRRDKRMKAMSDMQKKDASCCRNQ